MVGKYFLFAVRQRGVVEIVNKECFENERSLRERPFNDLISNNI